ncbi:uncharacterized protein LOC131671218 [Phymastichus coffea]|uniref:uncharacterized protein LOC131671218 n=1 Tax=Phymastichus coffea TaxID=108790 RepID=UPI00273B5D3D|nr:uncharacterized protein LOC131671218 [Phymastichus coffea]XP_058803460.1 uncharacterized protein LOC131671218 [Phymastichus coffea]
MASKVLFDLNYFIAIFLVILNPTAVSSGSNKVKNNVDSNVKDPIKDYILCRFCGADLADPRKIINHLSPAAIVLTNQTLFEQKGVEVQLLKNPVGIQFYSITLLNTKCAAVNNWQYDFSWYPGFAWKPCICEQCRTHHGWYFEPKDAASLNFNFPSGQGFYVLKLNNLQSENFANSLIVTPKSYLN